jgi:hypothetical protein
MVALENDLQILKTAVKDPLAFLRRHGLESKLECYHWMTEHGFMRMELSGYLLCLCNLLFCPIEYGPEEEAWRLKQQKITKDQTRTYRLQKKTGQAVAYSVVGLFGAVSNIVLLVVLFTSPDEKRIPTTNIFVANMAISDLLTSAFCCPVAVSVFVCIRGGG